MRRLLVLLLFAFPAAANVTKVTLLHFSDYHSHALPFYAEGAADRGGLARAIAYLRAEKKAGALVFSGGDMVNKGSPAWSDQYRCAEWPWLNGIVDAMAFGNHDADYGYDTFVQCRDELRYPILGANIAGFPEYRIFTVKGVRIGVFALAGSDFPALVKVPELKFSDRVEAAKRIVPILRSKADAVVLIGHASTDEDYALARALPGIDVILGTHSHRKQELTRIEGTQTWFIAPFQYLTYISRVELSFEGRRLKGVTGRLVRVDSSMKADAATAKKIAAMQRALEKEHPELFVVIGNAAAPLEVESTLPTLVMDVMRDKARADVAISTASSFRQSIDEGPIQLEELRAALPYDNEIVVYEMSAERVRKILAVSGENRGTDDALHVSGAAGESGMVRVATTDYLARVSGDYSRFFKGLKEEQTGLRVRTEVQKALSGGPLPSAAQSWYTKNGRRGQRPSTQSQPFSRAILAASTRLAAPSLLIASER